ncbi:MAG: hypothetical protein IKQ94_01825 [Bacteroidales bacterium]|nr:hypothetical protein [Bacteroidales bacterium]
MNNEYTTRSVTPSDLPQLAELIGRPELADRKDIAFEQSKILLDGSGNISGFIILRQRSLQDFFGGEIPDEICDENDYCYYDGQESWLREEMATSFPAKKHFEILYSYENIKKDTEECSEAYMALYHFYWNLIYDYWMALWADSACKYITDTLRADVLNEFNGVILWACPPD